MTWREAFALGGLDRFEVLTAIDRRHKSHLAFNGVPLCRHPRLSPKYHSYKQRGYIWPQMPVRDRCGKCNQIWRWESERRRGRS